MNTALHLALRLLLLMMVPVGLIFFGTFFAAVTKERRQNRPQRSASAMLGAFQQTHEQPHSPLRLCAGATGARAAALHTGPAIYFRGRDLSQRGRQR